MAKKEIKLLQQQIEKLNAKGFDFEAWKKYTIILLARIFGNNNMKIKQLDKIDYEFSSWSLRDASGNESYEEGCKKLAQEVLQAAIDELEALGLPKAAESDDKLEEILTIILDEFKGSQVKYLKTIINSNESSEEKYRKIKDLVVDLGQNTSYEIVTKLLVNESFTGIIG